MSNLPETPSWESGIHQLEEAERAKAGPGGVLNVQATQLANRTLYLKEAVDDLSGAVYSGSDIYETKEEGLLKTSEGEYFKVPVSGISDISYILYQNKSGVAVEILREKSPYSSGYQAATVVSSGAANTVAITIPGLLGDGSLIYFLSPILNTGAVNITVTDAKGAVVTRAIQKQNFAALVGNELLLNQPVLMEFRTGSANNFVLVASGPVAAELNARLLSLELNSLTIVSSVAASADAYTGATANTTSSQVLVTGRAFAFTPSATNTTRAPTLSLNGWTARTIKQAGGTALAVGDLVSGNPCFLMYNAASSDFRLLTYPGDRARILNAYTKGTVTSDATSPNAISLTIPGLLGDGTQITFEPVVANTGATTLVITDLYGNSVTRNLLKGANTALTGGELQVAKPVTVQYRGSPVNNFKLLYAGDPTTDILNLKSSVTTLQGAITDPYTKLSKKLIGDGTQANTAPFGKISFSNGVRTVTKKRIIITTPGSSIGRGAGSTGGGVVGAPFSPSALFIEAMKEHLSGYGEFEFIDDNQSIGGQAIHQFAAQLQNSPYFTSSNPEDWPDIVLIVGGMNDATPTGNFNRGRTYPLQQAVLENLIDQCTAKGAVVIVCTTPHHNVESATVKNITLGDLNVLWPVRTFNVTTGFMFDSESKTINSTAFAYDTGDAPTSWGGQILRPGHILRVGGVNTGDYTIAAISEDRQTITVAENIPVSGLINTAIQHINLDSIIEEVLDPPPSRSFVEANWSGSGVKVVGDARFGLYNSMVRTVARGKSAFVMECETPWFRLGVEVHGWSALFTSPNYNHPNDLGYTVSYKAGADAAAFSLCKLIYGEKYYLPS
ncbi:SGNH/GDSL hydrolase family protein [Klebsiella oxytoca]|uniref:SGNH/GDSL hydrolase family protein n=1 Tax=Klebsiella oxytoca TaxID=571 RepID=UPI0015F77E41|nr:SGNH/GDSL hydrolase family protein [Klebsiella oxytoca]MBA8012428.1 SGNH/GDSL hydrolase family protein [Klebsiella oxytoca]